MSKKDVNKPGQFKLAGRKRPGKDTVPERYKQAYAQEIAREEELAEGRQPRPARRRAAGKHSAISDQQSAKP